MRLTEAEYRALMNRKRIVRVLTGRRWEDEFALQLDQAHIGYLREFKFLPGRRFRFDFMILGSGVALEIDGAVHRIKGRFTGDREKGNLALLHGWRVLHVSPSQVKSGEALALLRLLLAEANKKEQTAALDAREIEA